MNLRVMSFALLLLVAPSLAAAASGSRDLKGELCGGTASKAEASAALLEMATGSDLAAIGSADQLARAALDGKLDCGAGGPAVLNLRVRATLETAEAALRLRAGAELTERADALRLLERRLALLPENFLETAAAGERDPALRSAILALVQSAALNSSDPVKRLAAIAQLAEAPSRFTLARLTALRGDPAYRSDPAFRQILEQAVRKVERGVRFGDALSTIYNGLSFASILFMAAIGLAIIFGLMGVINLAQGEFIMIGAYATWLVQETLRHFLPGLLDWYLVLAIPAAFLIAAGAGITLEALLLRHLYRRPLMSLLATWAVSLFLVNLVRVVFGSQNLQFETPFYITGGVPLVGDFIFTWNRMFAIGFAVATLVATWLVVRRTPLGLNIRAVMQNRSMAGALGIATRRVDMMAFGLGSGLAGLAGLALSPIYSVNPQMGQNFIIDSFMVVVLGGVGTIAGTVAAALGIGQINVLIEPFFGAVAAKVIVLTGIILFLQWRPEGLFSVKGRRR